MSGETTIHQTTILGAAGEHYVLFRLLRQGFIAALAPRGVPHTDIIVSDDLGNKLSAIQVKTRRDKGSDRGWHMSEKHETIVSPTLFYCFVDVGSTDDAQPVCYVVPSEKVARVLKESHQHWLNTPGKNGQPHNQTKMRRLLPDYSYMGFEVYPDGWLKPYHEAWHLLRS